MKWFTLILSFAIAPHISSQSITRHELRTWYLEAGDRKTALDSFTALLEKISPKTPCEESYYGMCYALNIQHVEGNWAKLKLVYKARNCLNHAVERDPKDTELHFLRFLLEHFLPSFLGLNKHIPEDLKAIFAHPDFVEDDPPLKKKAIEFLLWTKRCNPEQTAFLEAQLAQLKKKI